MVKINSMSPIMAGLGLDSTWILTWLDDPDSTGAAGWAELPQAANRTNILIKNIFRIFTLSLSMV
jgi:hypothetical protein